MADVMSVARAGPTGPDEYLVTGSPTGIFSGWNRQAPMGFALAGDSIQHLHAAPRSPARATGQRDRTHARSAWLQVTVGVAAGTAPARSP